MADPVSFNEYAYGSPSLANPLSLEGKLGMTPINPGAAAPNMSNVNQYKWNPKANNGMGGFEMKSPNGFDFTGTMENFALGAQGVTGLANAYNAWQQTKLMEEQLALQEALANRNIANQATTTNASLANQAGMQAQLAGGYDYGTAGYTDYVNKNKVTVDGSPIS